MARTKGALSRKTLAKQLGISLEEYLELEKNGKLEEYRTEHGIVDTVSSSIPNQKLQEHKQEVREELKAKKINKQGKTPSVSQDYKFNQKLTSSTKPNITKDTLIILPTSEPKYKSIKVKFEPDDSKKIEVTDTEIKVTYKEKNPIETKSKLGIVKTKPNECFCSRCHKLILKDSSFRLILSNMIPGIASYHYSVDDKQVLCYDCAHGLARVIDRYFEDEIGNEINSALVSELASDSEQEPNTPIFEELDDTNIKEMVKPVEDIKPSEDEDLVF